MTLGLLARRCCSDEARNDLNALHHVLVTVRPLPAVPLDSLHQTDLFPRVAFITLDHSPPITLYNRLLLLHLLLSEFAITESGTRTTWENEREFT